MSIFRTVCSQQFHKIFSILEKKSNNNNNNNNILYFLLMFVCRFGPLNRNPSFATSWCSWYFKLCIMLYETDNLLIFYFYFIAHKVLQWNCCITGLIFYTFQYLSLFFFYVVLQCFLAELLAGELGLYKIIQ